MEYAYGANLVTGQQNNPSEYGNTILTKHKIISSKNHKLYQHATEEPRGCLHANISIGNNLYNVFTTHLDCSREHLIRQNQAKDICKLTAGKNNVIFTGDLNATVNDDNSPVMLIKQKMVDSYDIANKDQNQATIKNGKRIDYILVSPELGGNIIKYKVIRNSVTNIASDHWPIVAKIKQ
jgi:endonuclease/exonuclease/phosphatase family metal-dependent hydrolase